jgi:hypothetical protein
VPGFFISPECVAASLSVGQLWLMLVTPPTIGKLLQRPRRWAHRRVIAGAFGPIVMRRGRTLLVHLAAVEKAIGIHFTDAQIELAAERQAGRLLRIREQQEAAHGPG